MSSYEPGSWPSGEIDSQVADYLFKEFQNIAAAFFSIEDIILPELNVEPIRPRTGMIVLADGTNWNPGSGAGFYGYRGGAWVKLG